MMARRNKPAQRVINKRSCDLTNDLDDWLEPHSTDDNDVVVCSSINCGKISSLDVLQDDRCSPSPKSRYNPLSFINDGRHCPTDSCSNRTSSVPVVVDCKKDEQFIAYGGQPTSNSTTTTTSNSSAQYIMSMSSSLPAVNHHPSDGSCDSVHHISDKSSDPITVLSDEEMDVHSSSDHVMSGENSSDHVMSGNSGDSTTTQRIKRKRRKLISSNKDLVAHWQPKPISVEGDLPVVTKSSTINNTDALSSITVEEHNSTSSCDLTTTNRQISSNTRNTYDLTTVEGCGPSTAYDLTTVEGHGSATACDLTTVEGHSSATACDLTTLEGCGSSTALDSHNNNKRKVSKNDVTNNREETKSLWSTKNTYTRASLPSVKSKSFYSQSSSRRIYDFAPFIPSKSKPNAMPLFSVQSKLKGYKIPHKSQQGGDVANDDDGTKKKLSLVEALSFIDQSSNTTNTSNTSNTGNIGNTSNTGNTGNTGRSSGTGSSSSKYFGTMGTSLERPCLASVSNKTAMLSSVHLDCSQASVGTLHGIAEGATLSMDSLTFELDDGKDRPHLIVIAPLIDAVQCCKINLNRQPYVMQLLLFSGPAKTVNSKAKISGRVHDPESSDNHLKFIQLMFDLKPSSEACETINKILEKINEYSKIGWIIERDTISSDEIYDAPTTATTSAGSTSSNKRSINKRYATRSKSSTTSPLQAIKDNYTISDDDDDDDDFESTTNTMTTTRRSTRLSSVTKVKPEDDKLLLSYRPGTLARAVSIFLSDLECLHEGEFLNDKIIDFYLKYLWYDKLQKDSNRNRVHVFSPFFHTRLVNSSFAGGKKGSQYDPELLHSRVKNWTKNVDLFTKELVILPVCQSSHWYVAVICHPGLFEATSNRSTLTLNDSSSDVISGVLDDTPSTVTSPQGDFHSDSSVINKSLRPCILILDSLGGRPRIPTIRKIRKYLTAEWKHKHNDKEEKDFSTFIVVSQNKLKVPLQENSSDCGLFVLQYVETLLQRVIIQNQSIPQTEEDWFTLDDISKKRNNLHELITTLSTLPDAT